MPDPLPRAARTRRGIWNRRQDKEVSQTLRHRLRRQRRQRRQHSNNSSRRKKRESPTNNRRRQQQRALETTRTMERIETSQEIKFKTSSTSSSSSSAASFLSVGCEFHIRFPHLYSFSSHFPMIFLVSPLPVLKPLTRENQICLSTVVFCVFPYRFLACSCVHVCCLLVCCWVSPLLSPSIRLSSPCAISCLFICIILSSPLHIASHRNTTPAYCTVTRAFNNSSLVVSCRRCS